MAQKSRPWNGITTGDAGPYSDANWQELYRYGLGLGASRNNVGVMLGSGTQPSDGLKVQAQSVPSTSIDVLAGSALVQGITYANTATVSFTIAANSSGNPRIDTVILRADYALQTVRLAVLQGTPAASPSAPSLTQTPSVLWEIPLADIAVANGFATITNANITRRYEWANAADGVYLDSVLNNSGGTLEDGDVVIWDTGTDRAVTSTTTFDNVLLAGVWRGRTANAGYGRVQVRGIGYVNASAAVTRGNILVTSATAKRAVAQVNLTLGATLGIALETTSGSGYVLTAINVVRTLGARGYQGIALPIGGSPLGSYGASNTLAANGGTALIPFLLTGPMLLVSVSCRNLDAASARSWIWALYEDRYNNSNTIDRVAQASGSDAFTPGAASNRTANAASSPVYLPPGYYYLALQNNHATNTFALAATAAGSSFIPTMLKVKTLTPPLGATLDIVAATWTASGGINAAALNGNAGNAAW